MLLKECRILVVEDDEEVQTHMKLLLEEDVACFYQAYNGQEGYVLYKEKKPDIILADIHMPKMGGLEMCEKIKNDAQEQLIILVSAMDDRDTLLRAIDIGVNSFVPKPIDMEIVHKKLEQAATELQKRKTREEALRMERERLHTLAFSDTLTSLPNRTAFNSKLAEALKKAVQQEHTLALFFIDLDDFKKVNDTHSHAAGDTVLQTVAKRICDILGHKRNFSRISGDEFAFFTEALDHSTAVSLAQEIIHRLRQPILFKGESISIGCSIGISFFPDDAADAAQLMHHADIAMYRAKRQGKNGYSFFGKGTQ